MTQEAIIDKVKRKIAEEEEKMKDAGNYSNYNYLMGYVDALKWLISEVD
jgi:hypothetical protein